MERLEDFLFMEGAWDNTNISLWNIMSFTPLAWTLPVTSYDV
jgi:hypothetical protein